MQYCRDIGAFNALTRTLVNANDPSREELVILQLAPEERFRESAGLDATAVVLCVTWSPCVAAMTRLRALFGIRARSPRE